MKALVAYSDSDEEYEGKAATDEQNFCENASHSDPVATSESQKEEPKLITHTQEKQSRLPRLPWTSDFYQDEWLCHVYIPGTFSQAETVHRTREMDKLIRDSCPDPWQSLMMSDTLHISLTRPIVLRRHERSSLIQQARDAVLDIGLKR